MARKQDTTSTTETGSATHQLTRLIIVHGDKGGVGKSFVAQSVADYFLDAGAPVAVIDADTANPDVNRMFENAIPTTVANVRSEAGWMDVMDFVIKHPGYTIVMNTPAGIGNFMERDLTTFTTFLREQDFPIEMELWWTMNVNHDSVNLLDQAHQSYGKFFDRTRVICNLHFANGNKDPQGPFLLWNECPLRTRIERANGPTLYFPGLHIRVVQKVFAPAQIMPFSYAADAASGEVVGLETSERWKLQAWRGECKRLFDQAFDASTAQAIAA